MCEGTLKQHDNLLIKIEGKWNDKLEMIKPKEKRIIWQIKPNVPNYHLYYYMSHFSLQLNNLSF